MAAINFKNLSQECKADYILFKRDLASKLEQLQLDAVSLQKVASWIGFTDKIYALEQLRRRGTQPDAKTVAKDWNDIIDQVKQLQEKVKNTYVPEGKQPELILKLYNESIDFLKKNQLITIPPLAEETWGCLLYTSRCV